MEDILLLIVNSQVEHKESFAKWLEKFFMKEEIRKKCTIEEFAIFFLNFVRSQTEKFVRGNSSSCDTPKKNLTSINQSKNSIIPSSTVENKDTSTTNTTPIRNVTSTSVALHKQFEYNITPITISTGKCRLSLNSFDESLLSNKTTCIDDSFNSNGPNNNSEASKYHKINLKFEEENLITKKQFNCSKDDDTINIQEQIRSESCQDKKKLVSTNKYDNINNNLNFSKMKSTSDKNVYLTELGSNDFPKLDKNLKSNTSTPIRKLNKSGSSVTNYNSIIANSNSADRSNIPSSGKSNKSGKSSRHSNPSTPTGGSSSGRPKSSPLCLGDFFTSLTSTSSSVQKQKNQNKRNYNNNKESTPRSTNNDTINDSSLNNTIQKEKSYKPRRVIPTPVNLNDSENFISSFSSPAFRNINEGNIMNISKEEIVDKNNCVILKDRAKLKSEMHNIVKEFAEEKTSDNIRQNRIKTSYDVKFCNLFETPKKSSCGPDQKTLENNSDFNTPIKSNENLILPMESDITDINNEISIISSIDFNKITNKFILNRLIEIHSALIELNLVTNILNEFTYLINFFNIDIKEFVNFLELPTNLPTTEIIDTPSLVVKQKSDKLKITDELNQDILIDQIHQPQPESNKNADFEKPISNLNFHSDIDKAIKIEELLLNKENEKDSTGNKIKITLPEEMKFQLSSTSTIDSKLITHTMNDTNPELVLKNFINCLFYSLGVLKKQRNLLALLDIATLRVILDNELLKILGKDLRDFLQQIYNIKLNIENTRPKLELSTKINNCGNFSNVSYQPDSDTSNNFTSLKESGAFKKQRDLFYVILRIWEAKHLSEDWNFQILENKIQMLMSISENPINMAHLAKLFTSQLIISLNFTEPLTDLDLGLSNIDMNKLTKLRQRLVTPSHFSQDYQFPANQQFFKDFVLTAQSVIFIEQLKIALVSELLELNDSTYESIDLVSKTMEYNQNQTASTNNNQDNEETNSKEGRTNEIITFKEQEGTSQTEFHEYLVRPEIISTMRVLAKFLALLIFRLHHYEGNRNSLADNKQIELRNMLRPEFDVFGILKTSVYNRRLIITLPWVIEFLSILDIVTLNLDYYRAMIDYLYELYMKLSFENGYNNENYYQNTFIVFNKNSDGKNSTEINNSSKQNRNIDINLQNLRPTTIFILKTCLGWLFEQLNNIENYYTYRQAASIKTENIQIEPEPIVENQDKTFFNCNNKSDNLRLDKTKISQSNKEEIDDKVVSEKNFSSISVSSTSSSNVNLSTETAVNGLNVGKIIDTFDPLLENILNVSCPFLADFRVSIMPTKLSKSLSRTGRLRHVTTKMLSDNKITTVMSSVTTLPSSPTIVTTPAVTPSFHQLDKSVLLSSNRNESLNPKMEKNSQTKLIEAFLHSQSLSVRRIIEFVIERTTSAVIKDFQMEVILKSKTEANIEIDKILCSDTVKPVIVLKNEMIKIFEKALANVRSQWDAIIENMIQVRVEKALDSLLPNETLPVIKSTCASIIIQKCKLKTESWKQSSLTIQNFYSKDIDKFLQNFSARKTEQSTELRIDLNQNILPSEILCKLQFWLHATSRRDEFVNEIDLKKFCDDLLLTLNGHILPTSFYKVCGITTVILVQNLVLKHSNIFTDSLVQKFIDIWYVDKMLEFSQVEDPLIVKKNIKGDSEESSQSEKLSEDNKQNKYNIFDSYFGESFLKPLCGSKSLESIEKYASITVNIIINNLLTISYVNDKFVSLFKQDWRPEEYENLKNILERISSNTQIKNVTHDADDSKSSLFMEMLSDLLRDIDDF
ncbi:MATH and LRR domain-containing protein PFE0570w [Condylostylus longicornis]|uniref:MATH and LRR domain-containing protein PFE0570w n=1 Tax=Condylostylus longicornis TaxID=2530218 RepID=UPI00244E3AE0|nr:MATH and LRR domain-containing protein PFE0570w [Condylostylus longicornis]